MSNQKIEIILASHNQNKVMEIQDLVSETPLLIRSLSDIGFTEEIIEDGENLEENALIKARTIYSRYAGHVMGEDSGVEIYSLGMAPGVYTARYGGPEKNPVKNMKKVLENLKGSVDRRARFRTAIALIWDGREFLMEGIVEGTIASAIHGSGGFGYDPIFIPDGYDKTFGELNSAVKQKISHRAKAVQHLIQQLDHLLQDKIGNDQDTE